MTPKIERLTPEQEQMLPLWHDRYLGYGLSTAPADRQRAETAISEAYRRIGRAPVPVIWVDSPLTASLMFWVLEKLGAKKHLRDSLMSSLMSVLTDSPENGLKVSLENSLKVGLRNALGASLLNGLGASLRDGLRNALRDSLWTSLGSSLEDSLRTTLEDSLGDSLGDSLRHSLWDSLRTGLRDRLRTGLGASLLNGLGGSLRDSLWTSLGTTLEDSLRTALGPGLWTTLEDSLGDSLENGLVDSLGASLRDRLRTGLGDALGDRLENVLGDSKVPPQHTWWWGQMDAFWIAFYRFCGEVVGVRYEPASADGLRIMDEICQSCGWWYPRDGVCIVCERPSTIRMAENRLHCGNGPAVKFRDGWSLYRWHGVAVPEKLILAPDSYTREDYQHEQNAEVRRAAQEILGERFWQLLDLKEIHRCTVGRGDYAQEAVLWRTREADPVAEKHIQYVGVVCHSTERQYMLCVPDTVTNAAAAVAWTFDVPAEVYAPLVEA